MRRTFHICVVIGLLGMPAFQSNAQELRAIWVDGFSEGIKTPEQIDSLLERVRRANLNAVFAQVRKSADAYYVSRYEPWASDDQQHFDSLAYLIEKAHNGTPRIHVHAWINTCAVGKSRGNPFHITELHPEWLSLSDTGEKHDGEAAKIDPGNPDAADWTSRVYLDVARHYDVDGIHFDFVRYGGTDGKGRWGYNPVNVARFNARYKRTGQPAPDDSTWKQWRRDQVTSLVRKVYAMATANKPKLVVSAATITWGDGPHDGKDEKTRKKFSRESFWMEKSAPMNRVFQDWRSWMKEGILDLNCQMSYYNEKKHPDFFRHWIDWGKDNQYKRFEAAACGSWLNPIGHSLVQIDAIRTPTKKKSRSRGVMLYSYSGTDAGPDGKERRSEEFFDALSQPSSYCKTPPFANWVEPPKMPWKEKTGNSSLYGFVLTADGLNPVDGAKVTLSGNVNRTQYTDGTGFYAFVDIPEAEYQVKVGAKGYALLSRQTDPGRHFDGRNDFFLGNSMPADNTLPVPGKVPLGAHAVYNSLRVIAGTDVFPDSMIVGDMDSVGMARVRLATRPSLAFQAGDRIAVRGTWGLVDGEATIDNATVRYLDIYEPGAANSDEPTEAFTGGSLTADGSGLPNRIRVKGTVTAVKGDRIVLNEAFPVEVMLAGRKDPGVESAITPIAAPEVGADIEVTGTATVTKHGDGSTMVRIRPWSELDITPRPGQKIGWIASGVAWIGVPFVCGLAFGVWRLTGNRGLRMKSPRSLVKIRGNSRDSRSD